MKKIKQRDTASECGMTKIGFTLIEMIITVALIVILSTISVPIYKRHSLDAKRAEGYALLGHIRDAQMQYFSEYRIFLRGDECSIKNRYSYSCNEDVLEIDARANKYFTNFMLHDANRYFFRAFVISKDAGVLTLNFNKTTGVTFQ